jgi:predicted branched-subunit amino acid permease
LLPQDVVNALGIALYCMFIALVVPPARKDKSILRAVLLTAALSLMLAYLPGISALSAGWRVILLALAIPAGLAWRDTRAGGAAV